MINLRWSLGLIPQFLVTGVMRSGTTLLQRIITAGLLGTQACTEFEDPAIILGSGYSGGEARLRLNGAFKDLWRAEGAPRALITKDPLLMPHLDAFIASYPSARVVISVRDPRDVVASILEVRRQQIAAGDITRLTRQSENEIADLVALHSAAALRAKNNPRVFIIRYEDMARQNTDALADLGRFLQTPLSYDLPAVERPESPFATPLFGTLPTDKSIGRYTEALSPALIGYVEAKNRATLEAFNYASCISPPPCSEPGVFNDFGMPHPMILTWNRALDALVGATSRWLHWSVLVTYSALHIGAGRTDAARALASNYRFANLLLRRYWDDRGTSVGLAGRHYVNFRERTVHPHTSRRSGLLYLADMLKVQGFLEDAEAVYRRAARRRRLAYLALCGLGDLLLMKARWAQEFAAYADESQAIDPGVSDLWRSDRGIKRGAQAAATRRTRSLAACHGL